MSENHGALEDTATESSTDEGTEVDTSSESTEESTSGQQGSEQTQAELSEIKARLARAEKRNKKLKEALEEDDEPKPEESEPQHTQGLSREEAELLILARDYDEDDLIMLKKAAKAEDVSLTQALHTDIFKLHRANREATEKSNQASLGASSGSGSISKPDTDFKSILEVGEDAA